ncbi:MAG: hypothetical protein FD166_1273 [Bacteroidetes bacterium]|nr:MAG: hypothetical protein FD166_1273 [Bacteroidota bacterium]
MFYLPVTGFSGSWSANYAHSQIMVYLQSEYKKFSIQEVSRNGSGSQA